jgi:hypothetical protein
VLQYRTCVYCYDLRIVLVRLRCERLEKLVRVVQQDFYKLSVLGKAKLILYPIVEYLNLSGISVSWTYVNDVKFTY